MKPGDTKDADQGTQNGLPGIVNNVNIDQASHQPINDAVHALNVHAQNTYQNAPRWVAETRYKNRTQPKPLAAHHCST
jgi:hypothetical protein